MQVTSVTDASCSCLAPSLNSLVVAPKWLGCVYEGLQHGREMKCFVDLAKGTSSQFTMTEVHGLQLDYCILDDGRMQLLIPWWKGCCEQLLQELHNSAYAGHLGACKTLEALQQRVWWPKMQQRIKPFVRGYSIC